MTGDRKAGRGQSRHIERTVRLIFNQGIPQRVLASPGSQLWERLLADLPPSLRAADEIDIYTDGSWAERFGTLKDVFLYGDGESVKASGGIVLTAHSDNWREAGVHGIYIGEGSTIAPSAVFPLELLAVVVAIKLMKMLGKICHIHTDCQGVQKLVDRSCTLRGMSKSENLILLQIGMSGGQQVNWIPGHPERVEPDRSRWSKHMIGNDLADMTADGDWLLEQWGTHGTMVTTSVGEILQQLSGEDMWMWVDANGSPITRNLLKLAKETRDREYLVRRDGYRSERGELPVWAGTIAKFASLQFDLKNQPLGERARRVRIIWDQGWHGGNIAKGNPSDLELTKCVLCGGVDNERHWLVECAHPECIKIRDKAFARIATLKGELHGGCTMERALVSLIIEWARGRADAARIWTGLWSRGLLGELEAALQFGRMKKKKVEILRGVALSVGKVLATAAADLWGVKVRKGVVTKLGAEKYERAIREVELLKSTGKKGPGKRKKAKEHEKDGLDGPEDAAQKKKSKRKKGVVDSELKLEDRIYNDFCWAKWQGRLDSGTSLLEFRKVWSPSHPRIGVGGGGDVGD
jgi:hypothetical protein